MKWRFNLIISVSLFVIVSIYGILIVGCKKDVDTHTLEKPNQFKIYTSSLITSSIDKVVADYDNNIWVGLENNGIAKFDGSIWTLYNSSNSLLPSNIVHSISVDRNNKIWVGTDNGLASFYNNSWTVFNTANSPFLDNDISVVKADSINNIWVVFLKNYIGSTNQLIIKDC
ncbi:MAG: two-component regulator propeller domain-containing protein [Bacteroidota bacterium]